MIPKRGREMICMLRVGWDRGRGGRKWIRMRLGRLRKRSRTRLESPAADGF